MGGVIPGELVTNALQEDEYTWILSSGRDGMQVWEEWRPVVEPVEKYEEELNEKADMGEGPSTGDLAPEQAPEPRATMPVVPGFWAAGLSD